MRDAEQGSGSRAEPRWQRGLCWRGDSDSVHAGRFRSKRPRARPAKIARVNGMMPRSATEPSTHDEGLAAQLHGRLRLLRNLRWAFLLGRLDYVANHGVDGSRLSPRLWDVQLDQGGPAWSRNSEELHRTTWAPRNWRWPGVWTRTSKLRCTCSTIGIVRPIKSFACGWPLQRRAHLRSG